MKKIWFFDQNKVDPSPEALNIMGKITRGVFTAAEYYLIAGAFIFLAFETKNWAVIVLAAILSIIVFVWLTTLVTGFRFFNWRAAEKWYSKTFFCILDSGLYLVAAYTIYTATIAIAGAFKKGIGI